MADGDPWKKWREMPRWQGCLLVFALAFLFLMLLVVVFGPDPDASTTSGEEAAEASASEEEEVALRRIWNKVSNEAEYCDEPAKEAADSIQRIADGTGNVLSAYALSKTAQDRCSETWLNLGRIDVEGLQGDREDAMEDAVKECEMAYFAKKQALGKQMEILDGDARPSQIQSFTEEAEFASRGVMSCMVGILSVAEDAGVELVGEESAGY